MLFTLLYIILIILSIAVLVLILFKISVSVPPPVITDRSSTNLERQTLSENNFKCGNSWIRKNRNGLWEMYLEGNGFERGVKTGKLTKELLEWQEKVFVDEIHKMVPNSFYLFFLKNLVLWLNRKLKNHISEEINQEIYGISLSASPDFNSIGTPFKRLLNYHAAHDIGHALQDMKYVGCTSFSVWGQKSADGKLISGRNFDFYINDDFGKEKILAFINPSSGLKFAMVTWAGMTGAVSGMNEKGLAVTINAAKSAFRFKLGTPISILIREVLQHAGDIEQAMEIIRKRNVFVSELIMVSSASDKKSVIIEKTPFTTELYETKEEQIICTNHCQSDGLKNDKYNIAYMHDSSSVYRYERVNELLQKSMPLDPLKTIEMLRDKNGKNDKNIGLGNEKAINQLLAHHGIVFQPEQRMIYISSPPYNMGEYMAYSLDEIFNIAAMGCPEKDIDDAKLSVKKDDFVSSGDLNNYLDYKTKINKLKEDKRSISEVQSLVSSVCQQNPEYFLTYYVVGNYFKRKKQYQEAIKWYNIALEKESQTITEENNIKSAIEFCMKK